MRTAMADDPTKHAIEVVAGRVLTNLAVEAGEEWGDHPGIGEHDWFAVVKRVREMADAHDPTEEQYLAAYEHLEQRAGES
jgi:hypothetical protein